MSAKSIWDTRFTPPKVALDADVEAAFLALDEWITIKGTHVELGENGEILHGMGGKFKRIADVPRKTIKQREGESIEQTHERAREVFAKQDAEKAAGEKKKETKEERMERLSHTAPENMTAAELTELGLVKERDGHYSTYTERYMRAMAAEEEGHPGALKEFYDKERAEGRMRDERTPEQRERDMARERASREESRQREERIKNGRLNRDWKADPPEEINSSYVRKLQQGYKISDKEAGIMRYGDMEIQQETDKALLIKFSRTKSPISVNNGTYTTWVPKESVLSKSDVATREAAQRPARRPTRNT